MNPAAPPAPPRLEDPYWGVGIDMTLEEETKKWFPTSNSSKEASGAGPVLRSLLHVRTEPCGETSRYWLFRPLTLVTR